MSLCKTCGEGTSKYAQYCDNCWDIENTLLAYLRRGGINALAFVALALSDALTSKGDVFTSCTTNGNIRQSPKRTPMSDAAWRARYPDGVPYTLHDGCPRCGAFSGKIHHDTGKTICDGCGFIEETGIEVPST